MMPKFEDVSFDVHMTFNGSYCFNENDIEMLEAVGTGIAMDNAMDKVKAAADFVCGSVSDDGVYHYCRENNLI